MSAHLFRCSSIGKLMTEAKSIAPEYITPEVKAIQGKKLDKRTEGELQLLEQLKLQTLSEGAKTYIRSLAAQEIFGVDFIVSSKEMEKGTRCEDHSIALLNDVRGLALAKNAERRKDSFITGEADLFDAQRNRGHDLKTSWSIATFPITAEDCADSLYEYQMRGYMRLWGAAEWEVNYCLVDTPDDLIRYEPIQLHIVSHIDPRQRVTSWTIQRDLGIEARMVEKVRYAREYFMRVIEEFDRTHSGISAHVLAAATEPATA